METVTCLSSIRVLCYLTYKLFDRLSRIPYIGRSSERYILITGCDSGFGNAAAKRLDSMGCHVFAGCLTEKGEMELKKTRSDRLLPISLDVTKPDSVKNAFSVVKNRLEKDGKGLLLEVLEICIRLTLSLKRFSLPSLLDPI